MLYKQLVYSVGGLLDVPLLLERLGPLSEDCELSAGLVSHFRIGLLRAFSCFCFSVRFFEGIIPSEENDEGAGEEEEAMPCWNRNSTAGR